MATKLAEMSWELRHPNEDSWLTRRNAAISAFKSEGLTKEQMSDRLLYQLRYGGPEGDELAAAREKSADLLRGLRNSAWCPPAIKGILDTTAGAALIRQDIDPMLHTLFVTEFPAWDRLQKKEANGLVHRYDQVTDPAAGAALGDSVIADLATVTFYNSTLAAKTAPIAEFAVGRGVGLKEIGAVRGGGAPFDTVDIELANGMTQLARDAQYFVLQGNASNSGGTAADEKGKYNANAFDGWRGVLGGAGTFAGNGAIALDQGSLGLFQSAKSAAGQAAQNGGRPTACFMTYNALEALDNELQAQQRFPGSGGGSLQPSEIVPGVRTRAIPYAAGQMDIIPIPGTTMGQYVAGSGALVEDVMCIDEMRNYVAWLYSAGWTVLQLPVGYTNELSQRYIIFGLFGLVQTAPLFNAKVRRAVA